MSNGFRVNGIVRAYTLSPELVGRLEGRPLLPGPLRVQAISEGNCVLVMKQHNLIVDIGLSAIAKFLGNNAGAPTVDGATFSELSDITVATMELGTTSNPPAPVAGDTAGVGTLIYQPPITVSYPDAVSVMFSGVLPIGEANGLTITEEALKLANGKLFAKATFSRPKTSAFAIQFDHTIIFARA